MLSKRSIRGEYAKHLLFSSAILLVTFSLLIYGYIKSSLYDELKDELFFDAKFIATSNSDYKIGTTINAYNLGYLKGGYITIEVIEKPQSVRKGIEFSQFQTRDSHYLRIFYPYNYEENSYLSISREITGVNRLLSTIFNSIMIINIGGLVLIQIYAYTLSNILSKPIIQLSNKLSKMDENMLEEIPISKLPLEFHPLGNSLNSLFMRIQNYLKYQKELFIGIAHELKTPLAAMKLKNEVVLLKSRDAHKYVETIKVNIDSIDDMNKIISSILDIGRSESAQFEAPINIDVVALLNKMVEDYILIAKCENKIVKAKISPKNLKTSIQPTLFNQIVSNFLQNSIKFTNPEGLVEVISFVEGENFIVTVMDEGCGVDGDIDIYAPFKRKGNKSGAGLGLFLAKNAADAMGAKISIENRADGKDGAIAKLIVPIKNSKHRGKGFKI